MVSAVSSAGAFPACRARHTSFKERVGPQLAQAGLAPSDVAAMVVDAIRTNRFWIVTHPAWIGVLADRVAAMPDGRLVQRSGG